jgi:predicted ATPase/DNA-binding XRE family transcriptional regulator
VEVLISIHLTFGTWLKRRRRAHDIICEELAGRIGCAPSTLYKIEADLRRPSQQVATLLAQQLNIPPDQLQAFIHFARTGSVESVIFGERGFHPPTNLLAPPTPLIGREKDVSALCKQLERNQTRLLTLVGPPGIGKTRLAIQAATEALDDFSDGAFFIALAPVIDSTLVMATIATTLGVPDAGPRTPLERLKAFLHGKQILLVLDNFEQVLAAASDIAELLSACLLLKLLVTSRAPLRIRSERQILVAPLTLPDPAASLDLEAISQSTAIILFIQRAQAVQSEFMLTRENAPTIAAICTRLDGLPLAIELISARVKLLSPSALLERLHGRLMLQSDGLRDLEPRQRTLNNAIDWSYQLLSAEEQTLFRRLGMFVGGWTLDAATAVCTDNLNLNVFEGLASLLDKSLIKQEAMFEDEPRFTMLETIREYALERLAYSGESEALQRLHASYFMTMVDTPNPVISERAGQWLERLEIELANIRIALNWSQTVGTSEVELRMALALYEFWRQRGHLEEGSTWLQHGLARYHGEINHELRAKALNTLGTLLLFQGDLKAAQVYFEESLMLLRVHGDTSLLADILNDYGMLMALRGETELAISMLEEGLALWRQLGDIAGIAQTLFFRGNLAYIQRDNELARARWEESLAVKRALGDTWMIANLLANLAMVALDQGDYRKAEVNLTESLRLLSHMGEKWQLIHTLEVLARLAVERGQESHDEQSLRRGAQLFGATEAFRETLQAQIMEFQRHSHEQGIAVLRTHLDAIVLKAAWAEGRAMSLEQAVTYAQKEAILP